MNVCDRCGHIGMSDCTCPPEPREDTPEPREIHDALDFARSLYPEAPDER